MAVTILDNTNNSEGLLTLINSMSGKDMNKLSPEDERFFVAQVFESFRGVTSFVPDLLGQMDIETVAESVFSVDNADVYSPWIGRFQMIPSSRIEDSIGSPLKIQLAAAMFADIAFKIDIFGEFRSNGLNHGPHATVFLECSGDTALTFLQVAIESIEEFDNECFSDCRSLRIVSRESAGVDIRNPVSLAKSFRHAADLVRQEADKPDAFGMPEPLLIEFDILENEDAEDGARWIYLMVLFYYSVAKAISKFRHET